ncbi:presqualene diphosphate synthase HpnD [Cupriavidus nantongensis]|uniref:presqualene diphosphate synthase HpnD n=1 Tax=Cupriavidus nantongensis TaxID=1796606 RepID=UPI00358E36E5
MAGTQIAASDSRAAVGGQAGPAASAGSSFHAALRILPAAQRQAMFEIYAFCRAVDDIADGDAPHAERLAALDAWRRDLDACYAGNPPAPLQLLCAQIRAFNLQQADFLAVIDGMTMDVVQDIRAPDAATLDLYCDRVASAVGRLAVRVFGMETECGIALAHHLGRALQLTNILRDIDEDAAIGRLYLPAEALAAAGIDLAAATPAAVAAHPSLGQACAAVAREAQAHYAQAEAIMARCPARQVRSPRIMAEVYHRILARLCAQGWRAPRQRVRLPRAQLLWIVLRHAIG